jgi:hypothetical protein
MRKDFDVIVSNSKVILEMMVLLNYRQSRQAGQPLRAGLLYGQRPSMTWAASPSANQL